MTTSKNNNSTLQISHHQTKRIYRAEKEIRDILIHAETMDQSARMRQHRGRNRPSTKRVSPKRGSEPRKLRSVTERQDEADPHSSNSSFDGLTNSLRGMLNLKSEEDNNSDNNDDSIYEEEEDDSIISGSSKSGNDGKQTPRRRVSFSKKNRVKEIQTLGSVSETGVYDSFMTEEGSTSLVGADSLSSGQTTLTPSSNKRPVNEFFDSSVSSRGNSTDNSIKSQQDLAIANMGLLVEHDMPPTNIYNQNVGVSASFLSIPEMSGHTGRGSMPSLASYSEFGEPSEVGSFYSEARQVIVPEQDPDTAGTNLEVLAPALPSAENPEKQKLRWEGARSNDNNPMQQPRTSIEHQSSGTDAAPRNVVRRTDPDTTSSIRSETQKRPSVDAAPMVARRRGSDTSELSLDLKAIQKVAAAEDSSVDESSVQYSNSTQKILADLDQILEDSVSTQELLAAGENTPQIPGTLNSYDQPPVVATRQETLESLPSL